MDHNKKILIIQSYNANKGDNSVIYNMLNSLKPYHYSISLTAFDADKARREYHVPAYPYLYDLYDAKMSKSKMKTLMLVFAQTICMAYLLVYALLLKAGCALPLPKSKKGVVEAYRSADLVVLPGGHFFTSFNSLITNFSHYVAVRFAQLLGKKVMVYSQTVGPFYKNLTGRITRLMAMRALHRADAVTLREADSLKHYNYANAKVTAETVFLLPVTATDVDIHDYVKTDGSRPLLGLTIHHIYYKHYFSRDVYMARMTKVIDCLVNDFDCDILIIPMEDKYEDAGDRPMIKEFLHAVAHPERVHTVDIDLSPNQTAWLIGQCDAFIGTKTHSVVYGLRTCTPTIAIAYQQKSTEFMRLFGMERYSINMADIDAPALTTMVSELLAENKQIRESLARKLPIVTAAAQENNTILNQLITADNVSSIE